MPPDHYAALGVEPGANQTALRVAYLRIMRQHHPDLRPGDPASAERARRANAAYAVLSDEHRRAAYDRPGAPDAARPHHGPRAAAGPRPAVQAAATTAYSADRDTTQRRLTLASLRFALALFIVGLVLLVAVTPP